MQITKTGIICNSTYWCSNQSSEERNDNILSFYDNNIMYISPTETVWEKRHSPTAAYGPRSS